MGNHKSNRFQYSIAPPLQHPIPSAFPAGRRQPPCYITSVMATPAPAAQKVNLRRPDIMEAVQAQVLSHYRSEVVERIRATGHVLSAGDLTVKLAKEFGFCYGVERAIDLAYAARKFFPPSKPIYLLGEIIHNPEVNDQIRNMGIQIISPKPTEDELARLQAGDVAIIPAFGTEVATRKRLEEKGCVLVDTTCGDVRASGSASASTPRNASPALFTASRGTRRPRPRVRRRALTAADITLSSSRSRKRITSAITSSTAATNGNSWKNSKAPTRKDSTPTNTCRPSVWPIKPRCCGARPRRCKTA